MSTKSIPVNGWLLILGAIAFIGLGVFGARFLPNLLPGEQEPVQDFRLGDVDRRTERIVPGPEQDQPATPPRDGPDAPLAETAPVPETGAGAADQPPGAGAQLDALMERIAADRQWREERRRLASDSPLTPGVRDMAEFVARGQTPGPDASRPSQDDELPGMEPGQPPSGGLSTGLSTGMDQAPTYLLARGSVIPAVLQTALDSDLPGLVRAQVSEDVRDSATGRHVLIPRGAQLVGTYGSDARTGQRRLLVAWTDLRLPETENTLALDRYGTLGSDGASGMRGKRGTGLLAALGAAVLFDLAGNATAILTKDESASTTGGDLGALIAAATGNATSRVADRYLGDLLSRGPRFRVKAGTRMNVLVEADMRLPAWEGGG